MRIAYLVSQYPKVSHTFIRREIRALEAGGAEIVRLALRGWADDNVVDPDDRAERERTRYVQKGGIGGLMAEIPRMAMRRPLALSRAAAAAMALSRRAVRPLPYHLVYLAQACRIRRWLDVAPVDHLHAHFGTNPAEIAHLVHLLDGPRYSFTIHGQDEIEGAKRLHFPEKIGASAFTVAVSAYCRSQILREIPYRDWDRLKIVHCGLDSGYFAEAPAGFPEPPVFLAVGRLSAEKGHLVLLDAFARLRGTHCNARLVLAGDGPMRNEIEGRIGALGLGEAVRITGWIGGDRVRAEIDGATALVQPSFIEGLPVVIMEAMARGRPVISTYVAGIPELVVPGGTGWLVPAGETAALAEAMRDAAAAGPETLATMGAAGRDRARERHSIATEAGKLAALFAGAAP